jgi:hypothetical protein
MSVEEATVALKGILGISNSTTTPAPDEAKQAQTPLKDSKKKNKKKQAKQTTKNNPKPSDTKSSSKKKNNNSSSVKKSRGKKNEDTKTGAENYAWSSFQSPPDASSLPLPAFGSLNNVFNQDVKDSSASEIKSSGLALSDLVDTDGRKDVEGVNISSLAISNESKKNDVDDTRLNQYTPDSKKEKMLQQPQNQSPNTEEPPEPTDPLAMLMNPTYGTAVNSTPSKNAYIQSPQYQSQQTYMQSPPPYGHYFQGPMSPQPSFVSIQVQVPPNLLPGRRMMVHVNPNQPPITVVVPEGIQPGMFMPVTVPMHMYNMGPMMNPPHSMHPGQFQSGTAMPMNQAYQQNYPIVHGPFTSPQGERRPVPPPEGSWAAKVATSQQTK